RGWNLLGTAHYQVDIGLVTPRLQWTVAVVAVVLGHDVCDLPLTRHGASPVRQSACGTQESDPNGRADGHLHDAELVDSVTAHRRDWRALIGIETSFTLTPSCGPPPPATLDPLTAYILPPISATARPWRGVGIGGSRCHEFVFGSKASCVRYVPARSLR